jgi:hypothetical protein
MQTFSPIVASARESAALFALSNWNALSSERRNKVSIFALSF